MILVQPSSYSSNIVLDACASVPLQQVHITLRNAGCRFSSDLPRVCSAFNSTMME
jgi:hypothetical protein